MRRSAGFGEVFSGDGEESEVVPSQDFDRNDEPAVLGHWYAQTRPTVTISIKNWKTKGNPQWIELSLDF